MKRIFAVPTITLGMIIGMGISANAEWYGGGQFVFIQPDDLEKVEGVDSTKGTELSDCHQKSAFAYGMKAGYFFPDANESDDNVSPGTHILARGSILFQ